MSIHAFISKAGEFFHTLLSRSESALHSLVERFNRDWEDFTDSHVAKELAEKTRALLDDAEKHLNELRQTEAGQAIIGAAHDGLLMAEAAIRKGREGIEKLLSDKAEERAEGERLVTEARDELVAAKRREDDTP